MDCPECGAFNSSLADGCADCGADLSRVNAAEQRRSRREHAEHRESAEHTEASEDTQVAVVAAPHLKAEAMLGGLLLGAGVVLRPVYYAYQQYVVMEAMASLGGFGVSGGTLEPMIAEILLGLGIAYLVGNTALHKRGVTWWVFALSVAMGAGMAALNHFKADSLLALAIACIVASLLTLAHVQHSREQA